MRNYQRQKNNPYLLPHNRYMRAIYLIRDYEDLKAEYLASTNRRDTWHIATLKADITAVERALDSIPEKYRQGVLLNILDGEYYPIDADIRTYQRWKQRFIYQVAKERGYINSCEEPLDKSV